MSKRKTVKRRKVKVVRLKPTEAVRVHVPKGVVPVVAHDHEEGVIEIAPVDRARVVADEKVSIFDWLFGK